MNDVIRNSNASSTSIPGIRHDEGIRLPHHRLIAYSVAVSLLHAATEVNRIVTRLVAMLTGLIR